MPNVDDSYNCSSLFAEVFRLRNVSLWIDADKWMSDPPLTRQTRFSSLKQEFILEGNHLSALIKQIHEGPAGPMLTDNSQEELAHFMTEANKTGIVTGADNSTHCSVYVVLAEVFSASLYPKERGPILDYLKKHIKSLLDIKIGWETMSFDCQMFRKIYYQLLDTFNLRSKTTEKRVKPIMMFSCFVLAIIAAIWRENQMMLQTALRNYNTIKIVDIFFLELANMEHFRELSSFFIVGLFLIVRCRRNGGYITINNERPSPANSSENDQFCERIAPGITRDFDFSKKPDDPDKLKNMSDLFNIDFISRGLLKENEVNTKQVARPKKPPVVKRKNETPPDPPTPRKMAKTQEKSPTKKKDLRKTSKQLRGSIHEEEINRDTSNVPGPSTSSAPEPPLPQNISSRGIIVPSEVGISPPVYVMQNNIHAMFRAEVERRKHLQETPEQSFERVGRELDAHYREIERVARVVDQAPKPKLTADQKKVHQHYKATWRQINPEPCYVSNSPTEKKDNKPTKATKR